MTPRNEFIALLHLFNTFVYVRFAYYWTTVDFGASLLPLQCTSFSGRRIFQEGIDLYGKGERSSLSCFEANVDFEIRFMVDLGLVGCGWVVLPSRKYDVVPEGQMVSRCQLEVRCFDFSLRSNAASESWFWGKEEETRKPFPWQSAAADLSLKKCIVPLCFWMFMTPIVGIRWVAKNTSCQDNRHIPRRLL